MNHRRPTAAALAPIALAVAGLAAAPAGAGAQTAAPTPATSLTLPIEAQSMNESFASLSQGATLAAGTQPARAANSTDAGKPPADAGFGAATPQQVNVGLAGLGLASLLLTWAMLAGRRRTWLRVEPTLDAEQPARPAGAAPAGPANAAQPLMPRAMRATVHSADGSAMQGSGGAVTLKLHPDLPAYLNVATADILALAQRMAEAQAGPLELLAELQGLQLPITALPERHAGVVSVTGNSPKGWNEDTALAFRSSHPMLGGNDVLMSFDGMGGLRDGKLASKFAALAMAIELHRMPDTLTGDLRVHLAAAFERVNRRFRKAAEAVYGAVDADAMRSTAIVLVAGEQHYTLGHQGDGHALLRRADGTAQPLMTAHKGAVSNVVTHSLGPVPDGQAQVVRIERQPGDLVLIASDGFDPVPGDQLLNALHQFAQQHPLQTVVEGITHECCQQHDARGLIADDNMSLVALLTPLPAHAAPAASAPPAARATEPAAAAHTA